MGGWGVYKCPNNKNWDSTKLFLFNQSDGENNIYVYQRKNTQISDAAEMDKKKMKQKHWRTLIFYFYTNLI